MFRERKRTGEKSKKMGTERTKRGNEYSLKNEYFKTDATCRPVLRLMERRGKSKKFMNFYRSPLHFLTATLC